MRIYLDISLNIENFSKPESFFFQQKGSLGYVKFMQSECNATIIRLGKVTLKKKYEYFNFFCFSSVLKAIIEIWRIIRKQTHENKGVALVHGFQHPISFLLLKLCLRKKCSFYIQHHSDVPFRNFFRSYLQKLAYKHCDGYFFSSKELANDLLHCGIISHKEAITELMEGSTDFTLKNKMECRRSLNINENFVFLWVGRLNKNKDPLTVLKAFEHFAKENTSACLFMIFGTDELRVEVEQFIKEKNMSNSIKLIGRAEHEKLELWYNAADVFVSASYYESSSYALCETLACGCFPLLTNIPSFLWMTGNGKIGSYYAPGDDEGLLKKLRELDPKKIETTREERRKHFEELLSFEAIAKTISSTINQTKK